MISSHAGVGWWAAVIKITRRRYRARRRRLSARRRRRAGRPSTLRRRAREKDLAQAQRRRGARKTRAEKNETTRRTERTTMTSQLQASRGPISPMSSRILTGVCILATLRTQTCACESTTKAASLAAAGSSFTTFSRSESLTTRPRRHDSRT